MRTHKEKIEIIMEALDCGMIDLNQWESEFIESIMIRQSEGKDLSWKQ